MMHYADLSPCRYFPGLTKSLVAVGWLERGHEYAVGAPGADVYARLKAFQRATWLPWVTCGGHTCTLCQYEGFYSYENIFVPGNGRIYAAPEGIVHYVGCHGYLPPAEFCEAVLRSPAGDTPEYFAALENAGWGANEWSENLSDRLARQRRDACIGGMIEARKDAVWAAIRAHEQLHGQLPRTIADATSLCADGESWELTVDGSRFLVTATYLNASGSRVSRQRWSDSSYWSYR